MTTKTLNFNLSITINGENDAIEYFEKKFSGDAFTYSNDGHLATVNEHVSGMLFDIFTPSIDKLESWYNDDFEIDVRIKS